MVCYGLKKDMYPVILKSLKSLIERNKIEGNKQDQELDDENQNSDLDGSIPSQIHNTRPKEYPSSLEPSDHQQTYRTTATPPLAEIPELTSHSSGLHTPLQPRDHPTPDAHPAKVIFKLNF